MLAQSANPIEPDAGGGGGAFGRAGFDTVGCGFCDAVASVTVSGRGVGWCSQLVGCGVISSWKLNLWDLVTDR